MHKKQKRFDFNELIIEEVPDYILVNKPPFISSLEDRNDPFNLLSLARTYNEDLQICHRLDKETSGLIVFAKNPEAYRHFAIQLEDREVKKVYHAVISGNKVFDNFEADEPIYTTTKKSRVDFRSGRPSLTLFQTIEHFKRHSLLKCFPVSGRMHQIRAHLAHHDSSIVQDPSYGGSPIFLSEIKKNFNRKDWEDENPMINRIALHAYEIAFRDLQGEIVSATADYPKDFSVLLKQLRKYK